MPYVWYVTVTYTDTSQMKLRYPDEKSAFDGWLEQTQIARPRAPDHPPEHPRVITRGHRGPRVLSVTQPTREYIVDEQPMNPVLQFDPKTGKLLR